MNVKQGVRRRIFKKSLVLLGIALVLGALCYLASSHKKMPNYNNMHYIYTLASVGLSLALLVYVAIKIRFFHDIFSKEFTGTIISIKRNIIRTHRTYLNMDEVVIVVELDGSNKKKKIKLPGNKVGNGVYLVGEKIHRLKGTRFPINMNREVEQHICPICGRDSCYGDECPDCNVEY